MAQCCGCSMIKDTLPLVVFTNTQDNTQLEAQLRTAGFNNVEMATTLSEAANLIAQHNPEIVLLHLNAPTKVAVDGILDYFDPFERIVVVFTNNTDDLPTSAVINAGVSAFVVDGFRPDRLHAIIDAAQARFKMFRKLREELEDTKRALEERKIIDQAKGILMSARGLDESEVYKLLRKAAMDQNTRIAEVAKALVNASKLLG